MEKIFCVFSFFGYIFFISVMININMGFFIIIYRIIFYFVSEGSDIYVEIMENELFLGFSVYFL